MIGEREPHEAQPAAPGRVFLGLDLGTCWCRGAAVDRAGGLLWHGQHPSGTDYRAAGRALADELAGQPRGPVASPAVVTGEGRHHAGPELQRRTEISCLARAAHHWFPRDLDVLDVGGRGCVAVQVTAAGRVQHFLQQRRCAAATGFFLEELARRLALAPRELGDLAASGAPTVRLEAECGLFAVAEATERVRAGEPLADLCRAALIAVTERLLEQGPLGKFVVLAGGVPEHFPLLGPLLENATGARVVVPPHAGSVGALGAALIARDAMGPP
ncbi:MAG TPA: BadF/BadG/BcrA/BcrD ATPase family protein [Deferrisomatales bacterium]|nr:BadF/BadG/BcrA/BcrD ATPase family protein [Deferrisomatales bacterium]